MNILASGLHLQYAMAAMVLGSARILPAFLLLPFLTSSVVSTTIRMPVVLLIGLVLWPHPLSSVPFDQVNEYFKVLAQELVIGFVLATVFALPFWVMHGVGSLIDNQRGATISSTLDPMSGVDTSELAKLFNFFVAALFLYGGGLTLMLETYQSSYQVCDPLSTCSMSLVSILGLLTKLMIKVIVLASPVLVVLLLSEMLLGLLSRFAPQMNAFSISLTAKSLISFFIIILYFEPVLPDALKTLWMQSGQIQNWLKPDPSSSLG